MNAGESKQLVLDFFADLTGGRAEQAWARTADTLTWELMAKSASYPFPTKHTKASYQQLGADSAPLFPNGLRFTVLGTIAEPDRVAVEAESYAQVADGRIYNNRYHFMVELKDAKIQAVREYLDSGHATEILSAQAG
jgi:ketosteroid isomerase-like protein